MMGGGFGPGAQTGAYGPGMHNEGVANALGITSPELWDARAAGTSVAQLAQHKNVDLTKVMDAAVTAHTAQLAVAVNAGTLTPAQADAMTALMKSHIENQFQASTAAGSGNTGIMGGRGMMGSGFGPGGRRAP